jgi:hypothetical protein
MSEPPDEANVPDRAVERIVVHPDQVSQRDRRPWRIWSLEREVSRYLVISAILVALGVAVFLVLARLFS